ncbi:type VI secretion system Vgr family protein (plasmid) [Pseudovibrio sp. FO-BEG1]|uniref:type VI secretion system Vgr family protein n=1 Tax=Pseudovibrio sp. (strain FO-BEG1) TaxID=911045 RepID=UPI000238C913|nr:type VI secretion system tip protein VgrG [Pseudovibrio sp. FO-BEG1]AEV39704.1 type VI secretion system Vgr family protein [Pseudovibrio sp. FO-BEG1]
MSVSNLSAVLPNNQDLAFSFSCSAVEDGDLKVVQFKGQEQLFGLYELEIDLVSRDEQIDLQEIVDGPAVLRILNKFSPPRFISGVISKAERRDRGHHHTAYKVTLRPAAHRLYHVADSRIFQRMSVPDIIKELLSEHHVVDVKWDLVEAHAEREYCVQYRETCWDFIERLAAEEGIWYFFEHLDDGVHRLVFLDQNQIAPTLEHSPALIYNATTGGMTRGQFVYEFAFSEEVHSSSYIQRDYTFKNPKYNLEQKEQRQEDNGLAGDYVVYDAPGRYKSDLIGKAFTRHRLEAARVDATTARGKTNYVHLSPGYLTSLSDHDIQDYNIKYMVLSVIHSGSQPQVLEEDGDKSAPTEYEACFKAMPARIAYRPPLTRKPLVDGPQMAHVVGPKGEEIFCDEHGRVKVQFPWDRRGGFDDKSSCWIRVAQNWAGPMWGHMAIPRIGQEVIVDFLEGDPDQPILTGRTYHAKNQPPYKLPDHKTKMVIRSDSHKAAGYNELSFEDQGGQENIFLHAQKDQTIKVLNNRSKNVLANQVENIGANKSITVGANHQEKVGGNMNLSVGGGGAAGGLLGALGALVKSGGKNSKKGAKKAGSAPVTDFASVVAKVGAGIEAQSVSAGVDFLKSGDHFFEGGKAQAGAGSAIGGLLSKFMPGSGTLSVVVEKFRSDTVGMARTEQIGMMKNTVVGAVQSIMVGKQSKLTVGEKYDVEVGKKITSKTELHTILAKDKIVLATPGGQIELCKSGVVIKGKKIDLLAPSINLKGGSGGKNTDKAMAEKCGK